MLNYTVNENKNKYIFNINNYDIVLSLDNIKFNYNNELLKRKIYFNNLENKKQLTKIDNKCIKNIYFILNNIYQNIKDNIENNKELAYLYLKYSSEIRQYKKKYYL
tara:strand:- start:821 stop:1138 length:318 start_codon:yes stop_codon:yes gene_type:complete